MKLTNIQLDILTKARKHGSVRCSARQERSVRKLADVGKVRFTIEVEPDAGRGRHRLVYVVTPVTK